MQQEGIPASPGRPGAPFKPGEPVQTTIQICAVEKLYTLPLEPGTPGKPASPIEIKQIMKLSKYLFRKKTNLSLLVVR